MIYLDNNATTKIDYLVLEEMIPYLKEYYGNPGSQFYELGKKSKIAIENARENIAKLINVDSKEIIFTSSATESNNFILKGASDYLKNYLNKGNHLITSKVEHESVTRTMEYLNGDIFMNKNIKTSINNQKIKVDRGYEVDFLEVNDYGQITMENLESNIKESTILGSFIWGNNETGNLNDIVKISELFNKKSIYCHSDATQVVGKIPIDMQKNTLDSISFSSHKIHGPKGVGAVYLRQEGFVGQKITSLIHGGSDQEYGYRAGTPAVHDIVGFGKAAEIIIKDMDYNILKIKILENKLIQILRDNFKNIIFLMDLENKIPGTISFIVPELNNQLFLKKISNEIAFSSGSACSASAENNLLIHLNMKEYKTNFFRISLGKFNCEEDLIYINKTLKKLGKYSEK